VCGVVWELRDPSGAQQCDASREKAGGDGSLLCLLLVQALRRVALLVESPVAFEATVALVGTPALALVAETKWAARPPIRVDVQVRVVWRSPFL